MVAFAISLNFLFTGLIVYLQKRDFLGQSIFSQSQTAVGLLSRDTAEGNYRRVMEQLSSKALPTRTQSILFYDLISNKIVTSNTESPQLVCEGEIDSSYFKLHKNAHISCLLINSGLLIQIISEIDPFNFFKTPQFITMLVFYLSFASVLTLLTILGMNFYLDRFILLLNRLLNKGSLEQNIPVEFRASFKSIEALSQSLEKLKQAVSQSAKATALNEVSKKVIHNIRNPLSVINMTLPLLKDGMDDEKEAIIQQSLQDIEISITKALEDYRGQGTLVFSNLYEIVNHACNEIKLQNYSNITISPIKAYSFSKTYNKEVDPVDFKSAITNILNNAVEAMPAGGNIQIEMKNDDDRLCISILDEGIGIGENIIAKIGTQGFSFNKKQGNGLGLYTAKMDIQSWGGEMAIDNRNDRQGVVVKIIF